MKLFNKVSIIGVGLIGGSIGLAIKKRKIAGEVVGVFRHESTMKRALKHKAVDKGVMDIAEGIKGAGLIIIAAPVRSIPRLAGEAIRRAKPGTIITDVGSTKGWVVSKIDGMLRSDSPVLFVGSHPMAGSEHTGVEFAKVDLLEGSPCIVTKTRKTDKAALAKIIRFWKALGAKVSVMTPEEHDKGISFVSHLPHLVAFNIASAVPEKFIKYAAEGFGDTTRVASSDPELWADILLTNSKEVLASAAAFGRSNKELLKILKANDAPSLVKFLGKAKAKRDKYHARQA